MTWDKNPASRLPPSVWPKRLARYSVIVVSGVAYVAAQTLLVPYLISWASRVTHSSPSWMSLGGWATTAFTPVAALVLMLDSHRRERQIGDDPINRPRVAHGHAVPGRGSGYWISRSPLILILAVAVAFAPNRLARRGLEGWDVTPGGDAFRHGWGLSVRVSLPVVIALLGFKFLAMFPDRSDRLLRLAGPLMVTAAPVLSLLALYASTH